MKVSIAVPCYNSVDTLEIVVESILLQFLNSPHTCQVILVNDGSQDGTWECIQKLSEKHSCVQGIDLMKNYGQDAARLAAVSMTEGDVLVYMDDDGQHPVDRIFDFVDKINQGYDVVCAKFRHRKHSVFRRSASWLNFWLLSKTIELPRSISISSYFALSTDVVRYMRDYKSPFPYSVGYLMQITDKLANVEIEHHERLSGNSRYNLKRLLHLWLNGFTSFSIVPLRMASLLGAFFATIGFIAGAAIIIGKLINPAMPMGYASTMAALLFMGGAIMAMLGLLGEYVGRIFMTVSDKPQYAVRKVIKQDM